MITPLRVGGELVPVRPAPDGGFEAVNGRCRAWWPEHPIDEAPTGTVRRSADWGRYAA